VTGINAMPCVQCLGAGTSAMAWAMQSIGWAEVGKLTKADDCLHKQLAFISNSFQVRLIVTSHHEH